MCFSLGASLSAFFAALVAVGWTYGVILDKYVHDAAFARADAESSSLLIGFALTIAFVQLVDAMAHTNALAKRCVFPKYVVGTVGYVFIALQPAALAVVAAIVASTLYVRVLAILLALVGLGHVILCLSLDAPLSNWLRVDVKHVTNTPFKICAVVYGFFSPSKDYANNATVYGSYSRFVMYFTTLPLATLLLALALVERLSEDTGSGEGNAYRNRASYAWASFVSVSAIGFVVASTMSQTPGHIGSVWCLVSNAATVFACAILQAAIGVEAAAVFAGVVVMAWVVLFALMSVIS